ncbi:MAG TPA: alpha/beta hydrolase [Streptosporangiaceae bacterium]|nr:alpha/beta hydrolase [Streptosporangiaceae bacterium]
MTAIVLVPGFWLGGWAWEGVTRDLRALGHDVYPVTLTGLADRAAEASPEVNVQTHVGDVVRVIEDNDLHDVVLVGHSGANMPVTGAADRIPGRLRRIVYVDTGPMPAGMAAIEFNPPEAQEALHTQVNAEGDGWRIPVPSFDPADDPVNYEGLTEEHRAALRERGTPEPFGASTQRLNRPEKVPGTPRTLIACTFTPEQVRTLAGSGNPIFGPMADMDIHHLPTGHWPMFSRPKDLAALLDEIARE